MTIEEIKNEMKQIQTRVEQLGRALELAEDECKSGKVPETLNWENGDAYYIGGKQNLEDILINSKGDYDYGTQKVHGY